ncbi:MAG: hypothetical protein JSU73_05405 [candidate division WOR-3 bacterium]|nr:MAG: hypothetical protein JSU73_05405 [candidate division WOR-3 bacterium]
MKNIRMTVGGLELQGQLDDSSLAERVWQTLPCESHGETWGKEVYFPIGLHLENTRPVEEVNAGDIAYWPEGQDLCIFFGSTPKSTDDKPVVASPVTVIGSFRFDPRDFDKIRRERQGIPVRVARMETGAVPASVDASSSDDDRQ